MSYARCSAVWRSLAVRFALVTLVGGMAGSLAPALAQGGMSMPMPGDAKAMPSPPATANLTLGGQTLTIKYNTPSKRGRVIMGGLVPYGKVWRTGANAATTLITPISLHIGNLLVPAGEYTIYTLPSATKWMLIINKQTKQWGTEYHAEQDLGRVEMKGSVLPSSQEVMSISFDDIKERSAVLHVRWETTDEAVKVSTP
jgi:hypothetical protein